MSIIRFIFSGDTKQLDEAGKRAKQTLSDVGKEARQGVTDLAKYSAAAAAAGAAIAAHLVSKSLDAIDAQAKLARTLNTTVAGLEVTTRAAQLSGVAMQGVEQATKDLTRRLSQAASGTGPAVDALARLNLTAQELQRLPLDKRIYEINTAINQFVPAAERAAVAGQLFGEEGSLAMQRIDPATLRAAAEDVERFGSALSQVDAAKVEAAQDAMARVQQVVQSLINQFTVELAPVITAVSKQFTDAAVSSGALGDGAARAFDKVIKAAAFTMDAIDGVKRTFEVAGQAVAVFMLTTRRNMIEAAEAIASGPIDHLNRLITLANKLPGIDLPDIEQPDFVTAMQKDVELAQRAVDEGWAAINETLQRPLPGGQFLQFVEEARAAGQEAAEAMAAAQEAAMAEGAGGSSPLFSDEEKDKIQQRLEALRQSYQTELQDLQEKFGIEQEILEEAREAQLITEEEYKARLVEIEQGYQDAVTEAEKRGAETRKRLQDAEAKARWSTMSKALGDLSTLMNTESRKMFEIGKAAAIGQTVMETYAGAQKAFSALAGIPIVGPALGAAAAGAAILSGVARVQAIRSQSFGGGGTPSVSNTQAVNGAGTPVGGGGGDSGGGAAAGPTYTLVGLDPSKMYNGRDILTVLQDTIDNGGRLRLGNT